MTTKTDTVALVPSIDAAQIADLTAKMEGFDTQIEKIKEDARTKCLDINTKRDAKILKVQEDRRALQQSCAAQYESLAKLAGMFKPRTEHAPGTVRQPGVKVSFATELLVFRAVEALQGSQTVACVTKKALNERPEIAKLPGHHVDAALLKMRNDGRVVSDGQRAGMKYRLAVGATAPVQSAPEAPADVAASA